MFAVIKTGGKQYKVSVGDLVRREKIDAEVDQVIELKDVLLLADGDQVTVGTPTVDGATVAAKVNAQGRGPKIKVFKFKRRKNYRRTSGHRQAYTELSITDISANQAEPA